MHAVRLISDCNVSVAGRTVAYAYGSVRRGSPHWYGPIWAVSLFFPFENYPLHLSIAVSLFYLLLSLSW